VTKVTLVEGSTQREGCGASIQRMSQSRTRPQAPFVGDFTVATCKVVLSALDLAKVA